MDETEPDMSSAAGLRESDIAVHDGSRITVPAGVRDIIELHKGDPVAVSIITDGDAAHFTRKLQRNGKVNIPARIMRERGIEEGDNVEAIFTVPEVPV